MNKKKVIQDVKQEVKKPFTARQGSLDGYSPEYRIEGKGEWIPVGYDIQSYPSYVEFCLGNKFPRWTGDILKSVGLLGYAQAQAIGWQYACEVDAKGDMPVEIRVVRHDVTFDLKAFKGDTE